MGYSAGGYIALMLATNSPYLAQAGVKRSGLRGAIGISGPYDLIPSKAVPYLLDVFKGGEDQNIYPSTFAHSPLPAALLLQGKADTTVGPSDAEHLATAWRRVGGVVVLKFYHGANHADTQDAMLDTTSPRFPVREDVLNFLEAH
jgi:dipeptidyl aminopeptidase/acylaminoacyl peptidase